MYCNPGNHPLAGELRPNCLNVTHHGCLDQHRFLSSICESKTDSTLLTDKDQVAPNELHQLNSCRWLAALLLLIVIQWKVVM